MKAGIVTTVSKPGNVNSIVSQMKEQIQTSTNPAKLTGGIIYATLDTDISALQKAMNAAFPGVPYLGVTSCQGIGYDGSFLADGYVSGFWFYGEGCRFAVASSEKGGNPEKIGEKLLQQSLSKAGISKDEMNFAVLFTTPGEEEYILKGIATKVKGRILYEIDGRPAADVYNSWMKNGLGEYIKSGESILAATSLTPLAVTRQGDAGITSFITIHPERVILPEKALNLFAEVRENETVYMVSTFKSLVVERGGRTAFITRLSLKAEKKDIEAALMIFCAGSMLTIRDDIDIMMKGLKENLDGVPHMVGFTFGEQGTIFRGKFEHGNLMNSVLLFTKME
jgi:hypothetical protein